MQVNVTGSIAVDTSSADGDISLTSTTGDLPIGLLTAGNGSVSLASAAAIKDTNGDAMNVVAPALSLTAVTGIGQALDPIEVTVSDLAATTQTGGIFIINTGSLNITTVNGVSGVGITDASAQDDIVIHTTYDMLVSNTVSNAGSGDIKLTSGHDITLNADIIANSGLITIQAVNSVFQNADIINMQGGDVTVVADEGDITMGAGAGTTVDLGTVDYTANDNVTVSEITTGTGGGVDVTADTGAIVDGNGSAPNIVSDDLVVSTPTGGAAEGNNSDFLFAFNSTNGMPMLIVFNNRIMGGTSINEFYQAMSLANSSMSLGDFILYNTLFDSPWRWSSSQDMLVPGAGAAQSPLPYTGSFTL